MRVFNMGIRWVRLKACAVKSEWGRRRRASGLHCIPAFVSASLSLPLIPGRLPQHGGGKPGCLGAAPEGRQPVQRRAHLNARAHAMTTSGKPVSAHTRRGGRRASSQHRLPPPAACGGGVPPTAALIVHPRFRHTLGDPPVPSEPPATADWHALPMEVRGGARGWRARASLPFPTLLSHLQILELIASFLDKEKDLLHLSATCRDTRCVLRGWTAG